MARNYVNSVPPEIWSEICAYLDHPDASNFRLSCRTLNHVGARFVLREITIRTDSGDFGRLCALAKDAVKSKCIQSLAYLPAVHHPVDINAQSVGPRFPFLPIPMALADGRFDAATRLECDEAQILRKGQIRIQDNAFGLLAEVLPNLTGLKSIAVNSSDWQPIGFKKGQKSLPRVRWCSRRAAHENDGETGRRAFASLLRALEGAGTKLRTLEATRLEWKAIGDLPRTRPHLGLFSNLVDLNLHFCLCPLVSHQGSDASGHPDVVRHCRSREDGLLPNFLASLCSLQHLAISFCYFISRDAAAASPVVPWLSDVIPPDHHWPRLTSLSLGNLNVTREGFLDVLSRHKDTLRKLELFAVWIDTPWPAVLPEIRAATLSLKHADVWYMLSDDRGQWFAGRRSQPADADAQPDELNLGPAVETYLVHGGTCPITDANMILPDYQHRGCMTKSRYFSGRQ
ncbi:hypothetical protein C8A00DRAFT_12926 [Chaetomidium leptoderma]|uniref:F-box domain-containing protein n=1 Tax=Chaetomidium leptoderma TaxID=669021 RepID=A0AAN6VSL6_9PEZI|nr:hypothetical protein C8A00DRAFT_12926 [Chaetomidium leptoderma]